MFGISESSWIVHPRSLRQVRHLRMTTGNEASPRFYEVEAVWLDDRGRIAYRNDRGQTFTEELSGRSPQFDSAFPYGWDLLGPAFEAIEVEAEREAERRDRPAVFASLAAKGRNWLARVRSASRAAWRELTR